MVPRVMTGGDLNMNSRRVINVKQAQSRESTHVADVNFVDTTMNNSNLLMTANYQKYVNDILNYSVGITNQKKMFRYLIDNRSSEFRDEVHVTGVKITNNDFHEVKKETNEMKLRLDLSKICTLFQLVNILSFFNCIFLHHQSTIQQSRYQLPVVLGQFQEHQLICLVITAEV